MKTKTQLQVALDSARYELGEALERVKELRMKVSNLRLDVAAERALRKSEREQKRVERIAALETKLANMRLKAHAPKNIRKNYRKPSEGIVYTPEQIAALNSERGLV